MTQDDPAAELPRIPGLTVLRLLGQGYNGAVYLAREETTQRPVAVKMLPPDPQLDPELLKRFRREARLLARHPHPCIVRLLAARLDQPPRYLVLQYLPGGDLRARTGLGKLLPPPVALAAGARVAKALAHLHRQGASHRDVKPENVLLDEGGRAYLADLGMGRVEGAANITSTGVVVGTPHYMAPELLRGEPATPSSDLFALGVVVLELLTGHRPRATPGGLTDLQLPDGPPSLIRSLRRCVAADPEDRWPDGDTLGDALLSHARELARAPSTSAPGPAPEGATEALPLDGATATLDDLSLDFSSQVDADVPPAAAPRPSRLLSSRAPVRLGTVSRRRDPAGHGAPLRARRLAPILAVLLLALAGAWSLGGDAPRVIRVESAPARAVEGARALLVAGGTAYAWTRDGLAVALVGGEVRDLPAPGAAARVRPGPGGGAWISWRGGDLIRVDGDGLRVVVPGGAGELQAAVGSPYYSEDQDLYDAGARVGTLGPHRALVGVEGLGVAALADGRVVALDAAGSETRILTELEGDEEVLAMEAHGGHALALVRGPGAAARLVQLDPSPQAATTARLRWSRDGPRPDGAELTLDPRGGALVLWREDAAGQVLVLGPDLEVVRALDTQAEGLKGRLRILCADPWVVYVADRARVLALRRDDGALLDTARLPVAEVAAPAACARGSAWVLERSGGLTRFTERFGKVR